MSGIRLAQNDLLVEPRLISYHLLQQLKTLLLKDFLEHFDFFTRRVATNKAKITH